MDREALLDVAARVRNCIRCPLAETRTHAVPGEGAGVFGHVGLEAFSAAASDAASAVASNAASNRSSGAAGEATSDAARHATSDAAGDATSDAAWGAGGAPAWSGLMLVGEAPGRNEDESGRPFCGAAGRNLDLGLAAAGLRREQVFVTSINKCRPPNNRDPRPDEKAACRPYLLEQVAALRPRIIVALGRHGLSGLVDAPPKQFSAVRGAFLEGPPGPDGRPVPVFCCLHPAAIIYRQAWRQTYLEDWERLGSWLRGEAVDGFPPLPA